MSEKPGVYTHSFNSTRGYLSLPGLYILFLFLPLSPSSPHPDPLPYGFSFMFVLCFNSALGSTLEWVCLNEMIGGWVAARDSWPLRSCHGVFLEYINGRRTQGASMQSMQKSTLHRLWKSCLTFGMTIYFVRLFFPPEMNFLHLVVIITFLSRASVVH